MTDVKLGKQKTMKIKIDGKEIHVKDPNKNIVEIGDEHGISITAPCFRNERKHGCCKACVIEANREQAYACTTKPTNGMEIVYKRDDLERIRKDRLSKYAQSIQSGNTDSCCDSDSSCGCDCSC